MKKHVSLFFIFLTISFYGCSKKEIVYLPVTTTSQEALNHYRNGILSWEVGDGFEMRTHFDSALAIDPNFAMALELYQSPEPRIRKEHIEKAKELLPGLSEAERKLLGIRESYRNGDMDRAL